MRRGGSYLDLIALHQILSHGLDQGFKEVPGMLQEKPLTTTKQSLSRSQTSGEKNVGERVNKTREDEKGEFLF